MKNMKSKYARKEYSSGLLRMDVTYTAYDSKGKSVLVREDEMCYSHIMSHGNLPKESVELQIFTEKTRTPFNDEYCDLFVKHLNEWGFPIVYVNEDNK